MSRIAVIDFETTGLSPGMGDRVTEIAVVLVENGQVVDRFQSLMNAGKRIPSFIEALTGISNSMLATAPESTQVMRDASLFVGNAPMVAHNASFDRRFWEAELARIGTVSVQPFACTMLLSKRLYPQVRSHQLGMLVDYHQLPRTGRAHRALADAEMAASLLGQIQHDLRNCHGVTNPNHTVLMLLQRCAKATIHKLLDRYRNV